MLKFQVRCRETFFLVQLKLLIKTIWWIIMGFKTSCHISNYVVSTAKSRKFQATKFMISSTFTSNAKSRHAEWDAAYDYCELPVSIFQLSIWLKAEEISEQIQLDEGKKKPQETFDIEKQVILFCNRFRWNEIYHFAFECSS